MNHYITTPIYYVNDEPHIGHCYTTIIADSLDRINLLIGTQSRMQTGTDEHGQKIHQSAKNKNYPTPLALCDEMSMKFRQMTEKLHILTAENDFNNNSNFIRTTDIRHKNSVIKFWQKLEANGWIYKGKYCGWYAVRDEAFYTADDLIEGKAPTGADVEWKEEECYFFRLSEFRLILLEWLTTTSKKQNLMDEGFCNQLIGLLRGNIKEGEVQYFSSVGAISAKNPLIDLCVSRGNLDWGIKVPTQKQHTIYVWLDALINYISALGYVDVNWQWSHWEEKHKIHVIGKDILTFHAIYWPAFLLAEKISIDEAKQIHNNIVELQANTMKIDDASEDMKKKQNERLALYSSRLPNEYVVNGWWLADGQKISKSLGNVIKHEKELEWLSKEFAISEDTAIDYWRYFLLNAMPLGRDGDYNREKLKESVNNFLVNKLGNLINRCAGMAAKFTNITKEQMPPAPKQTIVSSEKNCHDVYLQNSAIIEAKYPDRKSPLEQLFSGKWQELLCWGNEWVDTNQIWLHINSKQHWDNLTEALSCAIIALTAIEPMVPFLASSTWKELAITAEELLPLRVAIYGYKSIQIEHLESEKIKKYNLARKIANGVLLRSQQQAKNGIKREIIFPRLQANK